MSLLIVISLVQYFALVIAQLFAVVEVLVKETGRACNQDCQYRIANRAEIWLDRLPVLSQFEAQEC